MQGEIIMGEIDTKKDSIIQLIEEASKNKTQYLDLSGNNLTSLPPEITKLTNITSLILWNNNFASLPPNITKLTNLTLLDLSGNNLTSLPSEITKLTNLTLLDLSGNNLTSLPSEITKLTNLTSLYLPGNNLTSLPPDITKLTNLTLLDLSGNNLTSLPSEIAKLTNLTSLGLSENPLESPPPEIVKQGVKAIFEYLSRLPMEAIEHNEAKLILLGQGDVGKTCLAKRLILDKFIKDKTTKGIDILKWNINAPTKEHENIKLNVWDFGGQEIYHSTHQFFLTKRSVYILVWNARKFDTRDFDQIYNWLHTIEAFGENSPIILVMSKQNEWDDDLNMKDLREKFPQIVDLYKVDSEDGKGIPALREIISKTVWNLPHMRTPWIKSWFKVREKLEQCEQNWIPDNKFKEICKSEGLDDDQTDILDEYLHDLGVIIHFKDRLELSDMVILKPDWATKAVYKVLDTESVKKRGGILLHRELPKIWDTSIYPKDIYPKLLELMNKFELASQLPDKKSHLVAELLSRDQPEFEWDDNNNLHFYYRYDFLPAGVMTRFIVLSHQDLEHRADGTNLCWREGAVLNWEDTRAFVKVKLIEKLIEIKISGKNKKELLVIIRHNLDHINSSIKKVNISKEIPCNCSDNCPHKFNYEELLKAESLDRDTVDCTKSWNKVPLSLLLDGYEKKENRMKDINERKSEVYIEKVIYEATKEMPVVPLPKEQLQDKLANPATIASLFFGMTGAVLLVLNYDKYIVGKYSLIVGLIVLVVLSLFKLIKK